jgi:hypothetical protein
VDKDIGVLGVRIHTCMVTGETETGGDTQVCGLKDQISHSPRWRTQEEQAGENILNPNAVGGGKCPCHVQVVSSRRLDMQIPNLTDKAY